MTSRGLTCRELIEFLGRYLDGDLPLDERTTFDGHLAICSDCREYLSSYRETILLEKSAGAPEQEISEDVPRDLIAAILASRTRS